MKHLSTHLTAALEGLLNTMEHAASEIERIIDLNDEGSLATPVAMEEITCELADLQYEIDRVSAHLT